MKYGMFVYESMSTGAGVYAWLHSFDADAHDGRGHATFTADSEKAMHWPTKEEAWDFWRTQSTVKPLRPDGKPNRPLTSFTVAIEPLPTGTTKGVTSVTTEKEDA